MEPEVVDRIENLAEEKGRYKAAAYFWLVRALDYTRRSLGRPGHVTGQELLQGARGLALKEFGPMATSVFEYWGVEKGEDIGRIIFDLIEVKLLAKTDQDSLQDFQTGESFQAAFRRESSW